MLEVLETEVFPPPDIPQIITEDDTPVENFACEKQQRLLARVVCSSWGTGNFRTFLASANEGIFSAVSQPPVVPDVFIAAVILVRTIEASGALEKGRPECRVPKCLLLYRRRAGVPPPLKVKCSNLNAYCDISLDVRVAENWWEKKNRYYFIWEFGKPPEVVIEIVSTPRKPPLTPPPRKRGRWGPFWG